MNKLKAESKLKYNKLPVGWVKTRLGELGKFKTSSVDKKVDKNEKPVRLINYMNVYRGNFIDNSLKLMEVTANNHEITVNQVRKGDILFTPSSETPDDIGHSAVVLKDLPNTLYSYHLVKLTIRESISIDLKFRGYFCNFKEVLKQFEQSSTGVTRYTLSKKDFEEVETILPISLTEQQKIAEILETVDETIEKTDAIIEKYKRIRQGLMQDLLTRGIDENGQIRNEKTHKFKDSSLGRIPEEWEVVEIKKIAEQVHLKNIKNINLPVLSCTKYNGLVDSLEYFKKQIFSDDISKYKIVKRRQFAYATNHLEEGAIGYQDIYNLAVISPMYTVFESNKNYINDNFLFRVLKTEKYRLVYESKTEASVNRRGGLRWKYFSDIKIPVPSLPEQKRIASILSQIDETIEKEQNYKEKLERIKQGLMEDLLTGKVRVNHLIKEGSESV